MRKFGALLAVLATVVFPQPIFAQLAIDRLWVDLNDGQVAKSDIVLRNESEDVYYISVSPAEITDPGTENEQRTTYSDPEDLGLLVTPNRVVLRPDEMRAIRIVSLNSELDRDRIYRVNITPQIGELEFAAEAPDSRGLALKLLAAFDVLVTVRPEDSVANLYAQRDGNLLTLGNDGNSNLLLLDGSVCPAEGGKLTDATRKYYLDQLLEASRLQQAALDADDASAPEPMPQSELVEENGCAKLPGKRLYAGNQWTLAAAPSEYLKFQARRSADEDFRAIEIRCGTATNDSASCRSSGSSDAVAKAANLSLPRPMEKLK